MDEILKPCPFCGARFTGCRDSIGPVLTSWEDDDGTDEWFITCQTCDTDGPKTDNPDDAEKKWNGRKTK